MREIYGKNIHLESRAPTDGIHLLPNMISFHELPSWTLQEFCGSANMSSANLKTILIFNPHKSLCCCWHIVSEIIFLLYNQCIYSLSDNPLGRAIEIVLTRLRHNCLNLWMWGIQCCQKSQPQSVRQTV